MVENGGRKRRKAGRSHDDNNKPNDDDGPWGDAIRLPLLHGRHIPSCSPTVEDSSSVQNQSCEREEIETQAVLEVSGFGSNTGTMFARIRRGIEKGDTKEIASKQYCCWRVEDVIQTITNNISLQGKSEDKTQEEEVESPQTLLELGAVWILDPASADRPQNKPVWKRLLRDSEGNGIGDDPTESMCWLDERMTIRLHSRPSRYLNAKQFQTALMQESTESHYYYGQGAIIFERTLPSTTGATQSITFAILHKPTGVPSHATVDNGVENLLYQYKKYRNLEYASLPQRLDTETSGLVLVATHPRLATYFSKLLEQKTTNAATKTTNEARTSTQTSAMLQKRYRCLVELPKHSWEEIRDSISNTIVRCSAIVEHFVDANSKAPKTFVSVEELKRIEQADKDNSSRKWQLCKLRILAMDGPVRPRASILTLEQQALCVCYELEIELLTGRTHQIRGQLAALGCPIVGDPLYGTSSNSAHWRNRSTVNMALQCCALSFPMDASVEQHVSLSRTARNKKRSNAHKKRSKELGTALNEAFNLPQMFSFSLDSAWWRV